MSNVHLYLDNYQYYAGTVITGKAICMFRNSKEIRKIRIRLRGHESTNWTGTESYYDSFDKKHKTRTVYYNGDHDVLLRDEFVHGEGTIGAGEHVFPFQFQLPEFLPSSFQNIYGKIVFSVKATVDRPWKTDYEDEKIITMISPIKLQNVSASFQQPAEFSDDKTVCCFCCASGPVEMTVNLEKRAFVVGETLGVKVYCVNMSNRNVDGLHVEMKMILKFIATHPSTDYKYDSELVTSAYNSGVGAHGDKTFNMGLEIPPSTVVPNFSGCTLFSCDTNLKISAAISGCHSDLDITTDVALGHVPYLQAPPFNVQYNESAPPYPTKPPDIDFSDSTFGQSSNGFQPIPMPMPMPMPGYEAEIGKATGLPPYTVPGYPPSPTAPREVGAPSAPSKGDLSENPSNLGAANTSSYELPPPTYDEAAKNFD